jgi:clan AA aspartic protease (TIGR02281 family)
MIKKIYIFLTLLSFIPAISQTVIKMEKVNGVYKIPCEVNGIKMKFVLDTGASDVTISGTEASFLIKQGLISKEDVIGKKNYRLADGSISEGTKIRINNIKIGDINIKDVTVAVIENPNAPLLLGQSLMSRLGSFEIEGNILRIYPKSEKKIYEFLGIDLTKTIEDFGLSNANLFESKPLTGVPFESLKIRSDHELKDLNFDKQSLIFDENGKIFMIGLVEKFDEYDENSKKKLSREFYDKLRKRLILNFGQPDNDKSKISDWNTKNFEININVQENYDVGLFYIPKILIDEKRIGTLSTEKISEKERELATLRKEVAEQIDTWIDSGYGYNIKTRVISEKSDLKIELLFITEEDEDFNFIKFADYFAFDVLNYILPSSENLKVLKIFLNINFEIKFINNGIQKLSFNRYLKKSDLEKITHPLYQDKVISILRK